jgi:hypothetical protein
MIEIYMYRRAMVGKGVGMGWDLIDETAVNLVEHLT